MSMKNDAAVICPNCGTEMVRVRFEIEDGWIYGWLCECEESAAVPDAAEAIRNFNRALLAVEPVLNPPIQLP